MKAVQSDIGLRRSIYDGFMKTCGEFEELLLEARTGIEPMSTDLQSAA